MKAKRVLVCLFSFALVLPLLFGCSNPAGGDPQATTNNPQTTKAAATAAATPVAGPYDEKLTVLWGTSGSSGSWVQPGSKSEQYIEERYNIDLIPWQVDATNAEQMNLKLAAGEICDFGQIYKGKQEMLDTGLVRTVPWSMVEEYAPNYAKIINDGGEYARKRIEMPGNPDEVASFTGYTTTMRGFAWGNSFRLDWLENVGIQPKGTVTEIMPGVFWTEEAFTVDEFIEILTKFTFEDPNQNGADDTYGSSPGNVLHFSWAGHYGAFGMLSSGGNLNNGGKAVPYYATEEYKAFLTHLSELYNLGVIDPECVTDDNTTSWQKFTSGISGYQSQLSSYLSTSYTDRPPYSVIGYNAQARLLVTPPTIGANGEQHSYQYTNSFYSYEHFFGKDASDAVVERVLRFLNDFVADEELWIACFSGFEGETFEWAGEAYNSAAAAMELSNDVKAKYIGGYYPVIYPENMVKFIDPFGVTTFKEFSTSNRGLAMTTFNSYSGDVYTEYTEEAKLLNDLYGADRAAVIERFLADAKTGADVEATWDAYIADLRELGLDDVIELESKYPVLTDVFTIK